MTEWINRHTAYNSCYEDRYSQPDLGEHCYGFYADVHPTIITFKM